MENISYNTSDNNPSPIGKVFFNSSVNQNFPTSEAFKTLRTNLLFCGTDIKRILITSSSANEGKSTISAQLSKSLAEIDKRTLLIDADMRKSVLAKQNIKSSKVLGLSELLSGQTELDKVIYNTQNPNFDIIFSGLFPPNPVELLSNQKLGKYLDILSEKYDYIIIDSPPLTPVIDAAVIATVCDGAIIILASNKTSFQDALYVKEQLQKANCKILGSVLNEIDSKNRYYSKKNYYYNNK